MSLVIVFMQARIAGPLVELVSAHEQSVDPLLLQLAEAWKVAETQLGPEGLAKAQQAEAEDGEEEEGRVEDDPIDMRMEVEDLMEGLGGSKAAQLRQQQVLATMMKSAKRKMEQTSGSEGSKKAKKGEEQGGPSFTARLEAQREAGVAAGQAKDAAAFIPSPKWTGAKPGYAFKKGPQGQGYYVDR